ncbi:kinase-like protein [Dentipellis sp. KUC8613]|nr:kinase-like protein [Dentipellis sp. KUC8613]
MLQYTVHPPPLSFAKKSQHRSNDPNKSLAARRAINPPSALTQKRPVDEHNAPSFHHVPLTLSTSFSSSNGLPSPSFPSPFPSKAIPRTPYAASPRQIPASLDDTHARMPSVRSSTSARSSLIEDALSPGDLVGEGIALQGEAMRVVPIKCGKPTPAEMQEPAREFEVIRKLGSGSYAVVYLVREVLSRSPSSDDDHIYPGGRLELDDRSTSSHSVEYGRDFAVKLLSKANLDEEAIEAQLFEATIHQSLPSHSNIVTLHRTLETSSFLLLLLEFVPGEDLFYFLEQARDHYDMDPSADPDSVLSSSRTPPTPGLLSSLHPTQLLSRTRLRLIASMFAQMCEAVAVCHDTSVFHRDIKPENFIVTDGWATAPDGSRERRVIVKLSDFGLSTIDVESSDMDCGSAPYMSYECRNNVAPTYKPRAADVWSLGIVLINMLYHYNPWTDTAHGGCSSFESFREHPVAFFMQRFAGMTLPVATFLAERVFCILGDSPDDSRRISAREFGAWAKDLPTLLGHPARPSHSRVGSTASITGHPLSSVPPSRRPSSRQASINGSPLRPSAVLSRAFSRAPSLGPAFEVDSIEHLPVFDQDVEEADEEAEAEAEEPSASRSTSTTKRRKRGARKGKGGSGLQSATSEHDFTSEMLASASQTLARELSRTSKPTSVRSLHSPSSISGLSMRSKADAAPVPSPLPATVTVAAEPAAVVKKPSKWKLSFGKASADRIAPVINAGAAESISSRSDGASTRATMGSTASNVSSLIMGLSAPSTTALDDTASVAPSAHTRGRPAAGSSSSSSTWARGQAPSPPARNVSPTSTRSGRPVASSASSMASSNWRSSMASTNTSSSAFTRYSNPSTRSVSTYATSVSSSSSNWRNGQGRGKSPYGQQGLPPNIKIMSGVPWQLGELPRQMHADPYGDNIFGEPPNRKPRTRKPKAQAQGLGTIDERPGGTPQRRLFVEDRADASTSTTDLGADSDGADGSSPKKVQKGQINALAKMLSALRR